MRSGGQWERHWNAVCFPFTLVIAHMFFGCLCFFCLFVCLFFVFSGAAPSAYGGSQARGLIGAVATGLPQSQSTTGSEPYL